MNGRVKVLVAALIIGLAAVAWQFRSERACALRTREQRGSNEIELLLEELDSWNPCIRSAAAFDLQKTGVAGAEAVSRLIKLLGDSSAVVRWRAAAALGEIDVPAPAAVSALAKALRDDHPKVRYNATYSLGKLGAFETTRALAGLAGDADGDVRHNALYTLRFTALPADRPWICPVLRTAIFGREIGWLAAAETAALLGCVDLSPDLRTVQTEWKAACPSVSADIDSERPAKSRLPWAVLPSTGMDCGSGAMTARILDIALQRLTAVQRLDDPKSYGEFRETAAPLS